MKPNAPAINTPVPKPVAQSMPQIHELVARMAPLSPQPAPRSSAMRDLVLQSEEATMDLSRPTIRKGMMSGEVTIRLDSKIHIARTIPVAVLAALKRLATFAKPAFHENSGCVFRPLIRLAPCLRASGIPTDCCCPGEFLNLVFKSLRTPALRSASKTSVKKAHAVAGLSARSCARNNNGPSVKWSSTISAFSARHPDREKR